MQQHIAPHKGQKKDQSPPKKSVKFDDEASDDSIIEDIYDTSPKDKKEKKEIGIKIEENDKKNTKDMKDSKDKKDKKGKKDTKDKKDKKEKQDKKDKKKNPVAINDPEFLKLLIKI